MKNFMVFVCLCALFSGAKAQSFSGTIEFKYATQKDTSVNVYYIKDNLVKLDQYGKKNNQVEGSFIFDLKKEEITWVNPKRKLWGLQKSETPQIIRGQCIVSKGANTRKILGVKCQEYIVRNAEENIVITYWIASINYDFFMPMLKLWNGKDKQRMYFSQIKDLPKGSMPLMSEEKQISDGKLLTRLEATKIDAKAPSAESMSIPESFTKFEQ